MANNKVALADGTVLIDITDTTAEAADVVSGKVFYTKAGVRAVGTMAVVTPLDSYPVGSIYMSTNSTSPASLFGGSWAQLKDRFLLGAGDTYTAGNTGGASTVTLTAAQSGLPSHSHGVRNARTGGSGTARWVIDSSADASSLNTVIPNSTAANASSSHNNMPPYRVVYVWQRTS